MTGTDLLAPGSLLLASPSMLDPNFMHTVVVICRHSEDGALGFVLNHKSSLTCEQILGEHPTLRDLDLPIFTGGPVGRDQLQFLHRAPAAVPGGVPIAGPLHLGGELTALTQHVAAGGGDDVRLLLGYSGWGEGQLDMELQTGSWVTVEPRPEVPFHHAEREALWRAILASLGEEGEGLSQLPPDPSWN